MTIVIAIVAIAILSFKLVPGESLPRLQKSTEKLPLRWNLSKEDTIGTQLTVLYREVLLIQRQICTQLCVVGTADSALIIERCPLFRVSFTERFHCTPMVGSVLNLEDDDAPCVTVAY